MMERLACSVANENLEKDRKTLEAMGRIYCSGHHDGEKDGEGLCTQCRETVEATLARTESCPYGHEGNRAIMRYAAPRMTFRHPLMTLDYMRKKIGVRKL